MSKTIVETLKMVGKISLASSIRHWMTAHMCNFFVHIPHTGYLVYFKDISYKIGSSIFKNWVSITFDDYIYFLNDPSWNLESKNKKVSFADKELQFIWNFKGNPSFLLDKYVCSLTAAVRDLTSIIIA